MSPPVAIGPFRVLHQLGAGALGPVFRAFDPDRDRLVAIKLFKLDITPEQSLELSKTLSALGERLGGRPGVATLILAGIEGTTAYLVEQYVPADGLDTRLRRRTGFGVPAAVPLVRQVADILDAAAAVGVRHGALHPRDLLVSTTDEVTVTGLGVADAVEAVGGRVPIRRPYTAPERAAERIWDRRADVFSLGVIAFELLTGRRPVAGGAAVEEDADAVQRVLARAMAERPDDRFATAGDFADALEDAAAGQSEGRAPRPSAPGMPLFEQMSEPAESVPSERPTPAEEPAVSDEPALAYEPTPAEARVEPTVVIDQVEAEPPQLAWERGADRSPEPDLELRQQPEPEPEPEATHASADVMRTPVEATGPAAESMQRAAEPRRASMEPTVANYRPYQWPDTGAEPEPSPSPWRRHLATAGAFAVGIALGVGTGYLLWGAAKPRTAEVQEAAPPSAVPPPGPSQTAAPLSAPVTQPVTPPVPAPSEPQAGAPESRPVSPAAAPRPGKPPAVAPPAAASREPSRPPEPVRGRLLVRSSPSGARVTVDGRARGVTPLELRDLTLGSHTLVITRQGHQAETRRITLSARQPAQSLEVTLSASASPGQPSLGALDIFAKPAGARVSVNGRYVGVAPLRVPELAPGPYLVTIELEGHRRWSSTVEVAAGQVVRVSASLEPDVPR